MIRQYLRNWSLFIRGFRWLWTRELDPLIPHTESEYRWGLVYKAGWGPLWPRPFLLVYLFDYGLACLLGRGVQSMSRAFTMFGKSHWKMTGGLLWGSVDLWR